jgi:hypothetical protein
MEEKIKVNKLFLVGNGFDLALGLKTSYADFMFWLLKTHLINAVKNFGRQAAPINYRERYNNFLQSYEQLIIYGFSSCELFAVLFKKAYDEIPKKITELKNLEDLIKFVKIYDIEIKPKSEYLLFKGIYTQCELGWVDIEETYFNLIQLIINNNKIDSLEIVKDLNNELQFISNELKKYLKTFDVNLDISEAEKYNNQIQQKLKSTDFINEDLKSKDIELGQYYFLNFNYTDSLSKVIDHNIELKDKSSINHIHGSIKDDSPLVFGYGDEIHEFYKKIEDLRENEFFKHIKSFRYFQNNRYRDLLRFLNNNYFQVCIYGHSCEISDRVMLNEIFEHKNCVSVKVYFYKDKSGNDDFTSKTMNISRHFNSNKLMRQKIVEFNPENEIPQKNSQTELQ